MAEFGSEARVIQEWDGKIQTTVQRDQRFCTGTNLYDAIEWAAERLRHERTRKGIVLLTDGVDSSPDDHATFRDVVKAFARGEIPLYFVAVGTDLNPTSGVPGNPPDVRQSLQNLADVSGGRVAFPKKPEDTVSMYEQIGDDLRTSYVLGYSLPDHGRDGKRHKIEIRVDRSDVRVHQSRDSYVVR